MAYSPDVNDMDHIAHTPRTDHTVHIVNAAPTAYKAEIAHVVLKRPTPFPFAHIVNTAHKPPH